MDTSTDAGGPAKAYCWSFGRAEFDESRWELRVAGQPVALERKPLEVLHYLLRHAGEVVTKDELLAEVWAGRIVVEAVLTNAVGKLRKALEEDGQEIVTTLSRVGYRLAVPVSRRQVEFVPEDSRLQVGDAVPRRENWKLETALARTGGNEVWLARHTKTRETRVFKFSLAGKGLHALKREVTIARLLREALGERDDFVHVIDWDFDRAPYFVESEYGGTGLDHWPEEGRISDVPLATRLALFADAVDAVAAAHGVGVLHKDLKPANLLVYDVDGVPRLRVADFGSSRLLDSGWLDQLGITHLGMTQTQVITSDTMGTPLYLAPELAAGQASTVKSDIYALGVTLYQLVVGDFRRPLAAGWENDIADPLLRQDIADAASGDPAKRPESAALLAERIRNLDGRREQRALEDAVRARIADGEKRLAKVSARRPWMVAAMLALAIGVTVCTGLWQRSEQQERLTAEQRDKAEKQAKRAEAVVKFLSNDLIGAVSPGGSGFENNPTIKDLLERASESIDGKFANDPATQGSIHGALGISWRTLGDREQGEHHLRLAVENYRKAFGESDEQTLKAQYELVGMLAYAGKFDEARELLDSTDSLAGERTGGENLMALRAAYLRGVLLVQQQKVAEALPALERADRLQRVVLKDDAQVAAGIRINLSDAYMRQERLKEAESLLKEALSDPMFASNKIGEVYSSALHMNLARVLRNQGRYVEALPLAQQAVAATEKIMGPDQYQTLVQKSILASIHNRAGDCPSGLVLMRKVHSGMVKNYGADARATLVEAGNLAEQEYECGSKETGVALSRENILSLQKMDGGIENVHAQLRRYSLAQMLTKQKQYDEALLLLEVVKPELMAASDSTPGWEHRLAALRGEILIERGQLEAGRALLAPALKALDLLNVDDAAELKRLRGILAAQAG